MPVSLFVGQKKILLQKTASSRNIVLGAMCKLYYDIQKLASTYSISSLNASNSATPTLKWRFGAYSPRHLFCNFWSLKSASVFYNFFAILVYFVFCVLCLFFLYIYITVLPFWRNKGINNDNKCEIMFGEIFYVRIKQNSLMTFCCYIHKQMALLKWCKVESDGYCR